MRIMGNGVKTRLGLGILLFLGLGTVAQASVVKGLRFWQSPESTRVVLDLSTPTDHKLLVLDNPHRIVLDLPRASLAVDVEHLEISSSLIRAVRANREEGLDRLRIVLELKEAVEPKSFTLKPFQQYGDRLVVDLFNKKRTASVPPPSVTPAGDRDIVIAIDAGHGGEDPGAVGQKGTYEKHVTLQIARQLKKAIDAEPGLSAVLTRDADYFVSLRNRTDIARKHRADLFISIHADSVRNRSARGASVWVLSTRGARSEMGRWLETKENSSDLLGGVDNSLSLGDKDPGIAEVLLQLSMDYAVGASYEVANEVLHRIKTAVPRMHKNQVQEAAFIVLKNPDIPSLLFEAAFISNPGEEKLLKDPSYQRKMAASLMDGIKAYFRANPPDASHYASLYKQNRYVIRRGDTLSGIAQRYRVSVGSLRQANKLKSDRLLVGQQLLIPAPN